ncbi:MAG TPA: hypothetical protein ENJ18_00445 [Nannocystis exedens]|nr:hypothetical protein [Nannocystis exedens]
MSSGLHVGLRQVSTPVLRKLLSDLHHRAIDCPLAPIPLAAIGLQAHTEPIMNHLRGLDAGAVRAVLVAVLAERL